MKEINKTVYIKRFLYFNLYVIKGNDGDILIDTGFICMKRRIKRWLDKFNIKLIILTHAHVDHIWNASYIKKIYNCDIAISENDVVNIDNSIINSKPSNKNHRTWTKIMNYGMKKFNAPKFKIDMYLKDNQIIDKYGVTLKTVSLPGHTNGSIGVLYNNFLFAGDALVNRKKQLQIAYQNQDNEKAKTSYKKILGLNPDVVFLGHDKAVFNDEFILQS